MINDCQYNYDSINNVLYINESCGSQTAAIGYYSDGKSIFYWDGVNFDKFNTKTKVLSYLLLY
jgi:hypothetical protein